MEISRAAAPASAFRGPATRWREFSAACWRAVPGRWTALLWSVWLHGEAGASLARKIGPVGFFAREIAGRSSGIAGPGSAFGGIGLQLVADDFHDVDDVGRSRRLERNARHDQHAVAGSRQMVAKDHPLRLADHFLEIVDVARVDRMDAPLEAQPAGDLHACGHGKGRNLGAFARNPACRRPRRGVAGHGPAPR